MSKLPKRKRRLINLSADVNDELRCMDREKFATKRHFIIAILHVLEDYLHHNFAMVFLLKVA